MGRAKSTAATRDTATTEERAGGAATAADPQSNESHSHDFTIDRSLNTLLRSTANVLSSANEINRLVGELALEREKMLKELDRARSEQEALRAHVRELKVAAEVEVAEMRERARRDSHAILAEAQLVRDRARDNAKRLEARLIATEKRTRTLLRGLIASAEVAEMAKAELDMDSKYYSVDQPVSMPRDAEQTRAHTTSSPSGRSVTTDPALNSARQESVTTDVLDNSPSPFPPPDTPLIQDSREATVQQVQADQDLADEHTTWVAEEEQETGLEVSQIEPPPHPHTLDRSGALAPFRYQVFINSVQSFSKIEELETTLGELDATKNVSIVALQPEGVTFEVVAHLSRNGLLTELTKHLPNAKVAAVGAAGIEVQLGNSTGAMCQ